MPSTEPDRVAVGVIRHPDDGRILIARRPGDVHQGGLWEFPGGKLEADESVEAGLERELAEELAIRVTGCRPLIRIPWRYGSRAVVLETFDITAFEGEPAGQEGQPLRWVVPRELTQYAFPAANRAIVTAVTLPPHYVISADPAPGGEADWVAALAHSVEHHPPALVQVRTPGVALSAQRELARAYCARMRDRGATLLLNGDVEGARELGVGVHLRAAQLRGWSERPLPKGQWVGASCHDPDELAAAVALDVDFAVLGPVRATATHPDVEPIGWSRFAAWVADVPLPVFALGGVGPADVPAVRDAGGHGVAAIRAFRVATDSPPRG